MGKYFIISHMYVLIKVCICYCYSLKVSHGGTHNMFCGEIRTYWYFLVEKVQY